MQAYLDAGFLLTAIIQTTRGSSVACQLMRELEAPFFLNYLHQLQIENLLVSLQKSSERNRQTIGNKGQLLWRNYFAEGVFQLAATDWDGGFRVAIARNTQHIGELAPFLLLLHPALASVAGATHFLSFDPHSREVARSAGLTILPEAL